MKQSPTSRRPHTGIASAHLTRACHFKTPTHRHCQCSPYQGLPHAQTNFRPEVTESEGPSTDSRAARGGTDLKRLGRAAGKDVGWRSASQFVPVLSPGHLQFCPSEASTLSVVKSHSRLYKLTAFTTLHVHITRNASDAHSL
jgi:hypothetical protein